MYVSIPETPLVYTVSQEYFNTEYAYPFIGSETFNHTIGDPNTYPRKVNISSIAPVCWQTPWEFEKPVGQGVQFDSIMITVANFSSSGMTYTKSSEWAKGFKILGLSLERSYGTSNSKGYEIGATEECTFEGRVGQIEDFNEYEKYKYKYGMFVYYQTNPAVGNTYLTINYYVEDIAKQPTITTHTTTTNTTATETSESDSIGLGFSFITYISVLLPVLLLVYRKRRK